MLMFWKQKLVFLSVPKTGTTAYEAALAPHASMSVQNPPELKHAPLYRYNRFFRPMFEKVGGEEMETLAVVREPVSWLGSWYRYRKRPFLSGRPNSTENVTFDEFVQAYCRGDAPAFARVGSQAKFLEPRPNGVQVSHLFRYENPTRLIDFLEQRLEVKLDLDRANVSPTMELDMAAITRRKLERKFSADFALWESTAIAD
ncbi:gamma-glutamyl kinase [Thalassobius sp. MITS945101]|uniref:gamma-glutamyl kinase n=1 Tax=Thalassobius sp. MITS945101 TaxID=3096994 RepID=UPI00399A9ADC